MTLVEGIRWLTSDGLVLLTVLAHTNGRANNQHPTSGYKAKEMLDIFGRKDVRDCQN